MIKHYVCDVTEYLIRQMILHYVCDVTEYLIRQMIGRYLDTKRLHGPLVTLLGQIMDSVRSDQDWSMCDLDCPPPPSASSLTIIIISRHRPHHQPRSAGSNWPVSHHAKLMYLTGCHSVTPHCYTESSTSSDTSSNGAMPCKKQVKSIVSLQSTGSA